MVIPHEFTEEAVAQTAQGADAPYRDFHESGEPYRSLVRHNPWMRPPGAKDELEWGKGRYYDTTCGGLDFRPPPAAVWWRAMGTSEMAARAIPMGRSCMCAG